jgi:hypothetical protein
MTKVEIQEATSWGAKQCFEKSNIKEIPGAEKTVNECLTRSTVRHIGLANGEVACMWGLIPQSLLSNQAYLWLLTTDLALEHKFLLVRYSQMFVEQALKHYDKLVGHCEAGNFGAKRWVKWLGGEFGQPDGKRIPFVIKRKNNG